MRKPMHEMPEVSTIAPFEPHSHLQEGWQVKEWVLGRRMKLAQDSLEAWRRLKSRIGATLIAGFLTVLLVWGAPFSEGGLGWAVLPLTLLFGLVTLLGLLSMYAGFTVFRRGVVLELDADSQTFEGHPEPHTQILQLFRDFRHHRLQ